MNGFYNPLLVCLSLVVAFLASYTAVELAGALSVLRNARLRYLWIGGGAASMGVGIWSMHFIGMIAFSLPISVGYDIGTTSISLVLAIGASFVALVTASRGTLSITRLCVAGTVMGMGVAGMHYLGMHAMEMSPPIRYTPWKFVASVVEAVGASIAALGIAFTLQASEHAFLVTKRLAAAAIMALAITCMHYTGMDAANFVIGSICQTEHRLDGNWLAFIVTGSSSVVLIGTLTFLGIHASHLSRSLKDATKHIHYLGTHDSLTGLPNREQLSRHVRRIFEGAAKRQLGFAVFFIDLDGFKAVNDAFGHRMGDELLKVCADRLQRSLRPTDFVARLGGDEFVMVMDGVCESPVMETRANDVLERLREEIVISGLPLRVGASIGIALFPQDGDTLDALLHNADAAMYVSKQSGRNTFRRYDLAMTDAARKSSMLQSDLQRALPERQLSVVFQAKYSTSGGGVSGAEALIRWTHPELGNIPPSEFIPVAERTGLVLPIGDWVISEVCRCIVAWDAQGQTSCPVSINLSTIQLNAPGVVERIDAIVRAADVSPHRLMFEISESVALKSREKTSAVIDALQSRGYKVAIDGFGSGYASLSYLRHFNVNQIKVDKSFIQGLDSADPQAVVLVSAMMALAQTLKMEVVAEGVETEEQRTELTALRCDQMQGFLMSYPMAADQFQAFMHKTHHKTVQSIGNASAIGATMTQLTVAA